MVKEYLRVNGFEDTADSFLTEPGKLSLAGESECASCAVPLAGLLPYFTKVTKALEPLSADEKLLRSDD